MFYIKRYYRAIPLFIAIISIGISWVLIDDNLFVARIKNVLNTTINTKGILSLSDQETVQMLVDREPIISSATYNLYKGLLLLELSKVEKDQATKDMYLNSSQRSYAKSVRISPFNPRGWLGLVNIKLNKQEIDEEAAQYLSKALILGKNEQELNNFFLLLGLPLYHLLSDQIVSELDKKIKKVASAQPRLVVDLLVNSNINPANVYLALQDRPDLLRRISSALQKRLSAR